MLCLAKGDAASSGVSGVGIELKGGHGLVSFELLQALLHQAFKRFASR